MAATLTFLVSQQEARSLHKLQRVATCLTPIRFILSWQTHQWDVLPRRGQAGQPHPSSCHRPQMRAWAGGRGGEGETGLDYLGGGQAACFSGGTSPPQDGSIHSRG